MPIYEYQCEKCGPFEVTQRITDSPLRRCPECRGKVRKLISQTSFQLKGTGWYVTDYASKGDKSEKPAKSESKSESKSDSTAESKSSTKSASSSEKGSGSAAKSEATAA